MIITAHIPENQPIAVAIGTFDGIHRGHAALLRALKAASQRLECLAVVVTFQEHPLSVLDPSRAPDMLTTREERAAILQEMGMDALVEIPFTADLAAMAPEEFVRSLSPAGNLRHVVVGFNFHFGAKARGDGALIATMGQEMGFTTQVLPPFRVDGYTVSSTVIRSLVMEGRMEEVERLLGRWYSYRGPSVRGKQLGRTLGFPTINLLEAARKAAPPSGVYASYLIHRGIRYPGMTNVGTNPTVDRLKARRVETYVLGCKVAVAYGDEVEVELLRHTRGERTFSGVEALQAQLARDRDLIAQFHGNVEKVVYK